MKLQVRPDKTPNPKGLKKFSAIFVGLTLAATFITAVFEWLKKFRNK